MPQVIKESIGPTPCDEECAQVGEDGFGVKNRAECQRFKRQLERQFPNLPEGMSFCIVTESGHDSGVYREVGVRLDTENDAHWAKFDEIQDNLPTHWDERAKLEAEPPEDGDFPY